MKTTKTLFGIIVITAALCICTTAKAQRTATAVAVVSDGHVQKINLIDAGDGYDDRPLIEIVGGGGTGAKAVAMSSDQSGVHYPLNGIYVESGGRDYTSTPEVKIESPEQAHTRTQVESAKIRAEDRIKMEAKAKADAQAEAEVKAQAELQAKATARTELLKNIGIRIGFLVVIGLVWAALRKVQKTKTELKKGIIGWIDAAAVILALIFLTVGPMILKSVRDLQATQTSHRPSGSGSSASVTEDDVVGRWVGNYEGLTAMDITLLSGGSFISSAGDFAGGRHSSGKWHISNGNTVVIDYGDGGENLLFSYKNGQLVAMNGRVLNRK